MGQLAKPQLDDCNGQNGPMTGGLARKRLQLSSGDDRGRAVRFAALRHPARNQTTACPVHERLAEWDAAGVAIQSGARIDELSAHRDVLTGVLDRAARTTEGILFPAYRPKSEQLWVLSVKN